MLPEACRRRGNSRYPQDIQKRSYGLCHGSLSQLYRKRQEDIQRGYVEIRKIEALQSLNRIWRFIMKRRFKFDDYEVRIIVRALVDLRNQLIAEGRYTDGVDDLLIMLCK